MAFCEQCGAQIADDSVFCEQCGTRQSAIARQIPAVEVDPREESAEETPLPEQPVGGNRSIRLCPDGKYRWFYEFSMLKNPTVIFTCLNCGLVPVSVITLSSMRHGLVEALGNHTAIQKLYERYYTLLRSYSFVNGRFDEDLFQTQVIEFLIAVSKFRM